MRNIKKTVILFLISLVLVLGLSFAVSAKGGARATYDLGNITVQVFDVNDSASAHLNGVQYLRNFTFLSFNISVSNDASKGNITKLNITLPSPIIYVGNGSTNRSGAFFTVSSDNRTVAWNKSEPALNYLISATGNAAGVNITAVKFGFNAKVNSTTQQSVDIIIKITYNLTNHSTYTLSGNFTVDGAAPTTITATTRGSSTVNITFPEVMNATAFSAGSFNGTVTTGGKNINISTLALIRPTVGGSNTLLLTINKSILTNETPTIYAWSGGAGNLTDLAGNRFVSGASATATDVALPGLNGAMYSYANKTLTLRFNETVNRSSLNVDRITFKVMADGRYYSLADTRITSNASDDQTNQGDILTIVLSNTARDQLSAWRATSNFNISLNSTAIKDMSGNNLKTTTNLTTIPTINDTTRPNITSVTYNHVNKTIVITFNESVVGNVTGRTIAKLNLSIARVSNIIGRNVTNGSVVYYIFKNAVKAMTTARNGSIVNFTLTDAYKDKVENWSVSTLYLFWNETMFEDLAGNRIFGRHNNSGLNLTTYTYDATAPGVHYTAGRAGDANSGVNINISKAYSNRTGKHVYNVTILWNETMDTETNASVSAIVGSTAIPVTLRNATSGWHNKTLFWFTISLIGISDTDGVGTIYIQANDIRGTSSGNVTASKILVDTTVPKLLRAYYEDREHTDKYNFSGDFLYFDFTENVSVRLTTPSFVNLTFNVSYVQGNTIAANLTNLANLSANASRIRLQLNDVANNDTYIVIRGVYAKKMNTSQNASGIDIKRNQHTIADWAGNYVVPNSSAVDIADRMFAFAVNISTTIATPVCVNTTLMNNQLGSVGGTGCRSYTTSSWSSLSGGNMEQLVAYSCNFNKKLDLLLYTKTNTSCTVTDASESLSSGWNLVGVNGQWSATADTWLASLDNGGGNATGVTHLYSNIDVSPQLTTAFKTTTVNPYLGYWISAENPPSGSSWSFTGTGFY